MIGILVVTHSRMAAELCRAAEMILGPLSAVATINIEPDTAVDTARDQLFEAFRRVGRDGDGVLILTDIFGGTPTNISVELLEEDQVEILTGVNLPMLIKGAGLRSTCNINDLAAQLAEYARTAIIRPSELLR
ncbi:PTS sugar transporter subunit IIA [Pelovirga terrestris]|uniref:PTS system fructose subfamily IIA component n=1 Tax=Pelovirga terrestris TaxID=2771352 RepID=A0A8J6QSF2_9BACT|nr:PTS system fructose subfamily IIA component [Pelovirga terrestris]MBD1401633.1 PTS system fructose subfamily IIA component [Pelovirga terrestris]